MSKSIILNNFNTLFKRKTQIFNLNRIENKIFKSNFIINLSNSLKVNNVNFNSGSPSITRVLNSNGDSEYLINFRMLNYDIISGAYKPNVKINGKNIFISLNKIVKLNDKLEIMDENKIIIPPVFKYLTTHLYNNSIIGIEDMRIFNYNNKTMIIGTSQDKNGKSNIVSGEYNYENNKLVNINFIENTFNKQNVEKNWVYFTNKNNELKIIYKWFPLQICQIKNNKLYLDSSINLPKYFENARGSTCGFKYNGNNWFIVHLNENGNYYHFFAVFDINMNLIKYSQKFKFEGYKIEFCIGLEFKDDDMIVCYSLNDTISKMAIYKPSRLNELNWYYN